MRYPVSDYLKNLMLNENVDIEIIKAISDLSAQIAALPISTVKISATDTTEGWLDDELVMGSTKLVKTILNPAANETLQLDVDQTNIDHNLLLNYNALEHLLVGAIDHDSLLNYVAGEHQDLAQIITVAKSGGDFTDIKTAADSITDSSIIKRYVIQVSPGFYAVGDTIQLPEYTSIRGTGGATDTVLWYTGANPMIEFDNLSSDSVVQNVAFNVPVLADTETTVIKQHNGRHALITTFMLIQTANTGAKATALDIDDGTLILQACVAYYTFGGNKVGANTHEIIKLNGGELGMASCDWRIDIGDSDDDVIFINDSSDYGSVFWIAGNTTTRLNMTHASYSGTTYWYKGSGDIVERNIMANSITLTGKAGTGYIYYLDTTSGTGTINSSSNQISITGFANNYFSEIATGDILNTFFDDIVAVDGHIGAGTYNYANSPSPSVFAAHQIQLDNNNGNAIEFPTGQNAGEAKNYRFDMGCGSLAGGDQDGTVEFGMDGCFQDTKNLFLIELGNVYWASPTQSNDFAIRSFNGIATYQFISAFGGFNNPEYGWVLQRSSGVENSGKTMVFDNQTPYSSALRSMDFRIDGVNIMTIENNQVVDFPLQIITAPNSGLMINGYMALSGSTVFNAIDILTIKPQNAANPNVGAVLGVRPSGTQTLASILTTNAESTVDYATLENSCFGTIARLATWRYNAGIGVTELRIGEMASAFFGIGTLDSLTTIDFYFANAIEMQLQPNLMIFNAGANDPVLDWSVNNQLALTAGHFVIKSDSLNLYLGASLDTSLIYNGTNFVLTTDLQNPSDFLVDCGTAKTLELVETVWDDVRVNALSVKLAGIKDPSFTAFMNGVYSYTFSDQALAINEEEVFFTVQIPHTYKEGTDIECHVHWTPSDAAAGTVRWGLEYTWQDINGVFGATTIIYIDDATNSTDREHLVAPFPTITGTGYNLSSMLVCRLFRNSSHANDNYTNDAFFLEFDVHIEINTLGSRQEFIK